MIEDQIFYYTDLFMYHVFVSENAQTCQEERHDQDVLQAACTFNRKYLLVGLSLTLFSPRVFTSSWLYITLNIYSTSCNPPFQHSSHATQKKNLPGAICHKTIQDEQSGVIKRNENK